MSQWCGNCRTEIFGQFGGLYMLERTSEGTLRYANRAEDYVPLNSAICGPCWNLVPASEKHIGKSATTKAEQGKGPAFAYQSDGGDLVFLKPETVVRYFMKAVEIIINGIPVR